MIEPINPTKDNYTFEGWFTDEALTEEFDFATEVIEDLTLYAKWEAEIVKYTVTFDGSAADGEYTTEAQVVEDGTSASAPTPAPEKSGHAFNGWFTASTGGTEFIFGTTLVTANITLYAQFAD